MPWMALSAALLVGAAALLDPSNWPTPSEVVRVAASLGLLSAALYLPARPARTAAAAAWVGVVAAAGMPVRPGQLGADFQTFYRGAQALFVSGLSPYTAQGATAFPFPTFPAVHLLSLGGRLSPGDAYLAFVAVSAALLGLSFALLLDLSGRLGGRPAPEPGRLLLQAGLVLQPPILAGLGWGNSGALAGACVTGGLWCWLRGRGRAAWHAAAGLLALAVMVKPQLLPAAAFFLVAACREAGRRPEARSRAAHVGRRVVPWGLGLVVLSLPLAVPASLLAYRDFLEVAQRWHTEVAATHANNLALSALLAEAAARVWGLRVADALAPVTAALGLLVLAANLRTLRDDVPDALPPFLPWLLSCLLWTSLVWDWYLTLVLAGPLLLLALAPPAGGEGRLAPAPLVAGIACCTTASAAFFPAGILLLYAYSLAAARRRAPLEPAKA
ncbi:MAG: hypothetical protein ACE147_00100 [Candidatus Methylomirabilales bacterium]